MVFRRNETEKAGGSRPRAARLWSFTLSSPHLGTQGTSITPSKTPGPSRALSLPSQPWAPECGTGMSRTRGG